MAESWVVVAEPLVDVAESSVVVAEPLVDVAESWVDVAEPLVDVAESWVDVAESWVDVVGYRVDATCRSLMPAQIFVGALLLADKALTFVETSPTSDFTVFDEYLLCAFCSQVKKKIPCQTCQDLSKMK